MVEAKVDLLVVEVLVGLSLGDWVRNYPKALCHRWLWNLSFSLSHHIPRSVSIQQKNKQIRVQSKVLKRIRMCHKKELWREWRI